MSSKKAKKMKDKSVAEDTTEEKGISPEEKNSEEIKAASDMEGAEAEQAKTGEKNEKEERISQLEDELKAAKEGLLRKAAELENVRKRVQRERIQLFEEAKAGALEDFMPISDDLNRTLQAAESSKIDDSFLDGVKMVANKFQEILKKHGVERIDETGVPFDVNKHDAMLKQPAQDENVESDTVLQVLESGFKIGDRTIRHAKVIVSE